MNSFLELKYNDDNDTIDVTYKGCNKLDTYICHQIKPKSRVWSKVGHCWVITPDALGDVVAIGSTYFEEIKYFSLPFHLQDVVKNFLNEKDFTVHSDSSLKGSSYKQLYLIKDAPEVVIKGAYKALAKYYHPDNKDTGNSERFLAISTAYKAIKKERSF